MLPMVEMAYRRPDTDPAVSTVVTESRMAHGATMPSSVMGTRNMSIVPTNEATNAPADRFVNADCAALNTGVSAMGRMASDTAAMITVVPRARGVGWRSASLPPNQ